MEWWRTGDVRNAWQELDVDGGLVDEMVNERADAMRWAVAVVLSELTSPIERKLLLAFLSTSGTGGFSVYADREARVGRARCFVGSPSSSPCNILIECQRKVGKYTADFVVTWTEDAEGGRASYSVAVEADGHDFHEKTKAQAAHDKQRDRFFVAEGLTVLRFTGSEIHRSAPDCATEVYRFLYGKVSDELRRRWEAARGKS
jgi:very-short-patch-repair endonuclease